MFKHSRRTEQKPIYQQTAQVIWSRMVSRLTNQDPLVIAHNAVTFLGVCAICVLVLMFVKPEAAGSFAAISPFSEKVTEKHWKTEAEKLSDLVAGPLASSDKLKVKLGTAQYRREQQKKWVNKWLSRRFRVAKKAVNMMVSTAYETADELKLDPLLILAVISVESRFNPIAESSVGAQGLMQVLTRVHREKFEPHGGDVAALNPVVNIRVGSKILKEYVRRDGSIAMALKRYVGAANLESDDGYGAKVLSEYAKLQAVASGKRVRAIAVAAKPAPVKVKTADFKPLTKVESELTAPVKVKTADFKPLTKVESELTAPAVSEKKLSQAASEKEIVGAPDNRVKEL